MQEALWQTVISCLNFNMTDFVYTHYEASGRHADYDTAWLEETNQRPLNASTIDAIRKKDFKAVRDSDKDGYLEVEESVLKGVLEANKMGSWSLPLAPYFADHKNKWADRWRLDVLPKTLAEATAAYDFEGARRFFGGATVFSEDPLQDIAKVLALHLASQAMHSGVNVPENIHLNTSTGFSVHGSGRLRFDCGLFAELGHSDLMDIAGVSSWYIQLNSRDKPAEKERSISTNEKELFYDFYTPKGLDDPSASSDNPFVNHLILYANDGNGHNIIVDNTSVRYFKSMGSTATLHRLYKKNFEKMCFMADRDQDCAGRYVSLDTPLVVLPQVSSF